MLFIQCFNTTPSIRVFASLHCPNAQTTPIISPFIHTYTGVSILLKISSVSVANGLLLFPCYVYYLHVRVHYVSFSFVLSQHDTFQIHIYSRKLNDFMTFNQVVFHSVHVYTLENFKQIIYIKYLLF